VEIGEEPLAAYCNDSPMMAELVDQQDAAALACVV